MFRTLKRLHLYTVDLFYGEYENLILWVPVLLMIGISLYFKIFPHTSLLISIEQLIVVLILFLATIILLPQSKIIFIILIIISSGFLFAKIRDVYLYEPQIEGFYRNIQVVGTLDFIDLSQRGTRFVLTNLELEGIEKEKTPQKIRVVVRNKYDNVRIGERISFKSTIYELPKPVFPDSYDFSKNAYYSKIGGIGYTTSDIIAIQQNKDVNFINNFLYSIDNLRHKINSIMLSKIAYPESTIAIALLTGEQGFIPQNIIDDFRYSGITHLLSISGLHFVVVAGIVFFILRTFLSFFNYIALYYNTKKIAVIPAIFLSFLYLLLSGMPVAANRSFIMLSLVLIAILFDRISTPMRIISFAASAILVVAPEEVFSPSFQLSFIAVLSLVSVYQNLSNDHYVKSKNFIKAGFNYCFNIIISSLIASISTAFYTIYHFNNYSLYGVFTNLIAIPISSYIIMPCEMLSLFLMPMHLEKIAFLPMQYAITSILKISHYVSSLPYSAIAVKEMPLISINLISFGLFWLLLNKQKWRYLGIIIIIAGEIIHYFHELPNMVISNKGDVVIYGNNNKYYSLTEINNTFLQDMWLKRLGQSKFLLSDDKIINCNDDGVCYYNKNNNQVILIAHRIKNPEAYCKDNIILISANNYINCNNNNIIVLDKVSFYNHGTHSLYFNNKKTVIKNSF